MKSARASWLAAAKATAAARTVLLRGNAMRCPAVALGGARTEFHPRGLCVSRVVLRKMAPARERPSRARQMSGTSASGGGEGAATGGLVDVEGGKVEDESHAEGHLAWAERAKNIVCAHRRFQLTTYNRLPQDQHDTASVHTDTVRSPVTGFWHKDRGNLALLLRNDTPGHRQHADNASRMATASVAVGHLDPVRLVPVFTRVGLMPPVVRMVGDLVPVDAVHEDELRAAFGVGPDAGSLFWLEPGGVFFEDTFSKRTTVSVRDFRSAFVDPLALEQLEALHTANTDFLDYLPKFCRDFLGVPVEEAFLYSVDRAGFSPSALSPAP